MPSSGVLGDDVRGLKEESSALCDLRGYACTVVPILSLADHGSVAQLCVSKGHFLRADLSHIFKMVTCLCGLSVSKR